MNSLYTFCLTDSNSGYESLPCAFIRGDNTVGKSLDSVITYFLVWIQLHSIYRSCNLSKVIWPLWSSSFLICKVEIKKYPDRQRNWKNTIILMRKQNKTQSIGTHLKPIQALKLTYRVWKHFYKCIPCVQ